MGEYISDLGKYFRAMRIIYFYQYFGTPKGSWSTRVYEFCKFWIENGNEVMVVTSVYDKSDLKTQGLISRQRIDGIEIIVINVKLSNKHRVFQRVYSFMVYVFISCYFALKEPYDIAISSSGPLTVGFPGLIAKLIRGKKFVFEVRDIWPEGAISLGLIKNYIPKYLLRSAARTFYKKADLVVSCSDDQETYIRSHYAHREIITIPNASDSHILRQILDDEKERYRSLIGHEKYVVYAGTLGLVDDCSQIIEAFRVLKERGRNDIYCYIIGDGSERDRIEEKRESLQLYNVFFTGIMNKYEVFNYLQFSRASLFSLKNVGALNAASPNKIFDAFALGIPIVQMSSGWIQRLVDKTKCGINIPFNDESAFADAIEKICDDQMLFDAASKASKHLGETSFNRKNLAKKYQNKLNQICHAH